jgi:hypothetical protein
MSESVTVLETNPALFMQEFITAVQNGYYVENTNAGHVSDGILKEIVLYKNEDKEFEGIDLGEITIMERNTQAFLSQVCHAVAVGAKFDLNSLAWDSVGWKVLKGTMYLFGEYTKEDLAALSWEDFKNAVRPVVGSGRDRNLLLSRYLAATGQGV